MKLFTRTTIRAFVILLLVCALGASLKLVFFGVTDSSDYQEYVAVAQHIAGDTSAEVRPHRFLKPLNPTLVALLATTMSYQTAFIIQAIFFYFALVWAMYILARDFLEDEMLALLSGVYIALSYPILRYGVDILTETGALFFYVLCLIVTLRYIKSPSWKLLFINTAIVTLGFLWKEYIVVAAVAFGFSILLHSSLSVREKMAHVVVYTAAFLAVHIPLQVYVYLAHGYTYLSWYSEGVHGAIKQNEFTLRNIIKSTAALLSVVWLAVPFGLMRYQHLTAAQKRFWQVSLLPPFIGYAWGYISSRLLFVMAPPFLLVALVGIREWSRAAQITLFALAITANIAWLFLSYRVTL